jgi:hypothetical protein
MLCQRKRFQRAQYTLLVNGLKVYRHGTSIVPGPIVDGGGVSRSLLPHFFAVQTRTS